MSYFWEIHLNELFAVLGSFAGLYTTAPNECPLIILEDNFSWLLFGLGLWKNLVSHRNFFFLYFPSV